MTCIQWNQSYNVDVKEIDDQHQHLVDVMNKLCDSMDGGVEDFVISEILDELSKYAFIHFETEEKYFHEFGYEKTDEHIAQHKVFSVKVGTLKKDLEKGESSVSSETIAFLGKWFADHVLKYDKEYVSLFHEHGLY